MNCEHCQTLLLDHLYGLLEGADAASVDAHLATCPQCAAARAETARVQGLFAQAARSTFPNTKFEPPVQAPAPQKSITRAPTNLPVPAANPNREGRFARRAAAVIPWAVAAAVLLAVPGTVVPVLNVFDRAESTRRDADLAKRDADAALFASGVARNAHEGQLRDAQLKFAVAENTRTALLDKWMDEQKSAVQVAAARKLTIDVLKPATVQPGAPNDFLLVVRDGRDLWESRGTRMVAEVRTSDAVIFSQNLNHEKPTAPNPKGDEHAIRLPASVWAKIKPDTELTLAVSQVDEKTNARTLLQEVRLAGPVFTTLLVTDKQAYRPGERLFFRSLTLDRVTLKPPPREQVLRYDLIAGAHPNPRTPPKLTAIGSTDLVRVSADGSGRVEPVRTADGQPVRGVGCGEFVLPADLPDGDYTLVLRELPQPGGPPATLPLPVTRTVKVRAGAADHYAKLIGFGRASYVPGETVEAWAELKFQDKPVQDAEVAAVAVEADGAPLAGAAVTPKTDANGRVQLRFALPDDVLNGDVRLKVTFRAGDRQEAVADRVPVIGRRLKVEFFPESGDTIMAGVPCKVYVRATTPAGQPVDISGVITDGQQTLTTVKTLRNESERGANRGLASFTFTPPAGTLAWLKLDSPNSVYAPILVEAPVYSSAVALMGGPGAIASRTGFALPESKIDGVAMSVPDTITSPGQPIRVHLHAVGQPRAMVVGAYVRGRLADTQKVNVEPGQMAEVKLMAGADPRGGVVRVTAFEEVEAKDGGEKPDLKPVAERLVFRRAGEVLKLSLAVSPADGAQVPQRGLATTYTSGSGVNCAITATDEKNNPVAAVLWAAVVNTGVAPGAKDRTMPTHFLLAGDVKSPDELEYADFLLSDHKDAAEALDLVLGTQGWRRFAEQAKAPAVANKQQPPAGPPNPELMRLLVQNGQHAVWAEPAAARESRKLAETYAPLYESAVQAVARARAGLEAVRAEAHNTTALQQTAEAADAAKRVAEEKQARAELARGPVRQFRSAVWFGFAGFAALALLCGGVSLARPQARLPLGASTVGSFGLAAFLFVAAGWGDAAQATDEAGREVKLAEAARHPTDDAPEPAPRLALAAGARDAALPNAKAATPAATPEPKSGFVRPGGGMGGGFGAKKDAPGMAPAPPVAPAGLPKSPAPPTAGYGPPSIGRGPDAKGGFALPMPVRPDAFTDTKPGAPGVPGVVGLAGGGPGAPERFADNRVTAGDLALNRSSPELYFNSTTSLRATSDDRAALKKANDDAARYAHERQRVLADSLNAQFGGRGAAKMTVPEVLAPQAANDGPLTPAKIEALAVQQIRGSVNPVPPLLVREYAAARPEPAPLIDAVDAPDTILWQPVIVLPSDGKAAVGFALGNAPGGYRVMVAGHTADGRLGEVRTVITVSQSRTTVPPTRVAPGGSVPPRVPAVPAPPPGP